MAHSLTGSVDGVAVNAPGYEREATWYNTSLEEEALSLLDEEAMQRVGLDPEDEEDVDRYRYLFKAFDLRLLFGERVDDWSLERDLSVYFFDLEASNAQPGDAIEVFDISAIEPLRSTSEREDLGGVLRALVDEMRDNGRPDAVVAFAPDRSKEGAQALLINLLGQKTLFATSGTATFADLYQGSVASTTLRYPLESAGWGTIRADVSFGEDRVTIDAECISYNLSTK